nr:MAG TPA: hypothetical protein [Caudoviricetes sp.]
MGSVAGAASGSPTGVCSACSGSVGSTCVV